MTLGIRPAIYLVMSADSGALQEETKTMTMYLIVMAGMYAGTAMLAIGAVLEIIE